MEQGLLSSRQRVQSKQPEIERTLAAIERLIKAREASETLSTYFDLCDNVLAKAAIEPCEKVFLWLGSGVLVEYTLEEARELLTKSLADTREKESQYNEDLTLVREQAITSEVNMSRTFNHDVKSRRGAAPPSAPSA
jgi:prefoldin subunit 5